MRDSFLRVILGGLALAGCSAWAQMHKVAKPEQVVRAVGVYEWTGDMMKPTASRLIPVSIFIEGKFEDAGVYVARPVPFALLTGNIYELQAAGIDRGLLDLSYARHVQTADGAFDDGWFGYGSVKSLPAAKRSVALHPSKTLPVLTSSKSSSTDSNHPASKSDSSTSTTSTEDPERPTMKRRPSGSTGDTTTASSGSTSGSTSSNPSGSTTTDAGAAKSTGNTSSDDPYRPTMKRRNGSEDTTASSGSPTTDNSSAKSTSSTPADDPDRPTMKRRDGSEDTTASSGSTTTDTSSAKSTGSTPADDPDRPTMKRRSSDTSTDTTASTTGTGSTPADDPDRPTLKRHSAEDAKNAKNGQNDVAMATGMGSLNDDPDRPNLHHGKPVGGGGAMAETDLPKLEGLPPNTHQMVAVSDAANRDPHEFTRDWADATERATVLEKMQGMARTQLAAYGGAAAPATAPAAKKTPTTKSHRTAAPAVAAPEPLLDEELKAYTLSYGGAATYIYTAHTAGTGAKLRYVTVVAQADGLGELKPAMQSVTDAAHLDRTPRMKFVDVVDAEASNRASLLFELRGQSARQFGLYRVIAARSEQVFLTGTTQ
jgi:hypothetical protein